MFDYLQKFNALPQNLRDSVSSPSAMAVISELEKIYKLDLAALVMKVMVKSVPLVDLPTIFVSDFYLSQENAKKLTAELKEKLFFVVSNYLGYIASYSSVSPKTAPVSEISIPDRVIKEVGIVFAGTDLNQRLKAVLATYLKGVRSRVDTRITLNKLVVSGGLGLDHKVIDKIFTTCDNLSAPQDLVTATKVSESEVPKTGLEKVRALYEKPAATRDIPYDLSAAILKGEIKKPIAPFNLPMPDERNEKLIAEPEEELRIAGALEETSQSKFIVPAIISKSADLLPVKTVISPQVSASFTSEIKNQSTPILIPSAVGQILTPPPIATPTVSTVSQDISAIIPAETAKIIKPAEKGPSLLSQLFNKKNAAPGVAPLPKPIVPIAQVPVPNPSVASRRMEAASSLKMEKPLIPVSMPRQVPKVMSPIDELRYLDLVNFRRFGSTPTESIAKVVSKIKLLEKDGYEKKISGIMAWKQNPINKIYLKMGQEALNQGQSLKQFALSAEAEKRQGLLSWEEIELIIKLNNQFMF